MGSQSRWGSEDQAFHASDEIAVERTINFENRSSSLLDSFIEEIDIDIDGDTPEDIARSVAFFTDRGENGRHPRWMHDRFALFRKQGIHLRPDQWGEDFTNQTGLNVNRAVNGIARLLSLLSENRRASAGWLSGDLLCRSDNAESSANPPIRRKGL